jgi:ABC-2 type transport system ATP-binding protein
MISCHDIEIRYGFETILKNVHLTAFSSQKLALLGPNGSGKTSLLRVLAGLSRPHAGHVFVNKQQVWPTRAQQSTLRSLYLNSHPALLLDETVIGNLDYYCRCFHMQTTIKAYGQTLQKVGLEKKQQVSAKHLSTGQKRKLTLACALLIKPQVLLADEPTNGLDAQGIEICLEIFEQLAKINNSTLVVATHDLILKDWCDSALDVTQFIPKQVTRENKIKALL